MTADLSVAELVRCSGALLLVVCGAAVLGAMIFARVDDGHHGFSTSLMVPVVAFFALVLALQPELS